MNRPEANQLVRTAVDCAKTFRPLERRHADLLDLAHALEHEHLMLVGTGRNRVLIGVGVNAKDLMCDGRFATEAEAEEWFFQHQREITNTVLGSIHSALKSQTAQLVASEAS